MVLQIFLLFLLFAIAFLVIPLIEAVGYTLGSGVSEFVLSFLFARAYKVFERLLL